MAKKFEKVGEGQYGVYREKKTDWGSIALGVFLFFAVMMIIGAIAG